MHQIAEQTHIGRFPLKLASARDMFPSHHLLTSLRFKSLCPGGAGGNVWLSRFCWSAGTAELRISNA